MSWLRETREAWLHHVRTGRIDRARLRTQTAHAWERSAEGGARTDRPHAESLSPQDTERLLARQGEFIAAARPYMEALSVAARGEKHAVMLGDPGATVLAVLGHEQSVLEVPTAGALLSEPLCGANGIGTAAAERGYVELVGPEHFIADFHPFTCQGIPIAGVDGETAGVLSTSVPQAHASLRLRDILVCAAHGIRAELLRRSIEAQMRDIVGAGAREADLLDRLRQDLVQAHSVSRLGFERAAHLMEAGRPPRAAEVLARAEAAAQRFGVTATLWRELASAATEPPRAVELGERVHALLALLEAEASIRRVEVHVVTDAPVVVRTAPRLLLRQLLRSVLDAFDRAGDGGAVLITCARSSEGAGSVVVTAQPSPGRGRVGSTGALVYRLDVEATPHA